MESAGKFAVPPGVGLATTLEDAGPRQREFARRRIETQRRILEAATHEFAERGYFAVTMREIAARAGVALGLAYHYFAGKEDLLQAQIEYATGVWMDEYAAHMNGREFSDLRDFLVEYLMFMRRFIREDHPHYYRFYMKHIEQDHLPRLNVLRERVSLIDRHFEAELDAAFARGQIRPGVDRHAALFLLTMVSTRLQEAFFDEYLGMNMGLTQVDEDEARARVRHLVNVFLGGILREEMGGSENVTRF